MKYCLNCDWRVASADEPDDATRSRRAIDHHVETGHTVDSSDGVVPPRIPDVPDTVLVRDLVPSND